MLDKYKGNNYEPGKVIIALRDYFTSVGEVSYEVSSILDGIDYEKAEVIYHSGSSNRGNGTGDILLVYLKDKDKSAVFDVIEKLSSNPYVVYAEPDYREDFHVIPRDPLYKQLWGIKKIEVPLAWNYTTGDFEVVVGVIDSGIDHNHPDIRRNMWVSPNGQIRNGWNFADDGSDSMDTNGHGTHVAGTIGAVGNNCIGITGVCWDVKVVSMKFGLDNASAIASIDFANHYNIPILNASWGGPSYSRALRQAISQYDGLFIASAGNNGTNNDFVPIYPASYDCNNIISVAAADPYDTLADFSNYGVQSVDLAAPGTNILSLGLQGEYSPKNGTSMAAPHVAGAAALLKAYMPGLTTLDLKNIILSSALWRPNLAGRVLTSGMLNVNTMFKLANYIKQGG